MTTELEKKLSDESAKLFTRLDEITKETKSHADVLVKAEVDKLAEVIAKQQEELQKITAIEKAVSRIGSFEGKLSSAEEEKSAKQFDTWLKDRSSQKTIEVFEKELRTDSNPDGGFLVRPQFSTQIVTRIFETSPIRQLADVETIGTNELVLDIDDNEAGVAWVGEGGLGSDATTPQIGQLSIKVHKMATKPRISTEALEDPVRNLEAWLQGKVSDKFGRFESTYFVSGNGVSQPTGLLSYDAWANAGVYERGKIERVNSGSSGAFTADGLIELQNSLLEPYQANATWLLRRSSYASILKLKSTSQYHFLGFQPSERQGVVQMTILGRPVVYASDMPATGAGNLAAVYGDFRAGYKIVDRAGIQILRDPYSVDGFVVYKVYKRVGGAVQNYDALKIQTLS
jgi:HK97 family phage major capsid protein